MTKEQKFSDALAVQVERRIFLVRGQKVMLDTDLAELYRVPTKSLNLAVKRNADRFPEDFTFQLTDDEAAGLRFHFETSKRTRGGRRYLPYAFTEQGVAMLSSVTWNPNTGELTVDKPLTPEQEEAVMTWAGTEEAKEVVRAAVNQRAGRSPYAPRPKTYPADNGVLFTVPVLALRQGEFFHQFEEDDIIERNNWTLSQCDADLSGFIIPKEQRGIVIDIEKHAVTEKEKIQQRFL